MPTLARDCQDIAAAGHTISGPYTIDPLDGLEPFSVYCELHTNGIGWTVFQRRFNGSVDFDCNFEEYENGFGDIDGEYWLGLRNVLRLTRRGKWTLMVDIETNAGDKKYAVYDYFHINSQDPSCYSTNIRDYFGTAGNALRYVSSKRFYAKDDSYCARTYGGWWYSSSSNCDDNLNGDYKTRMKWGDLRSLKASQMKIRHTL